MALKTLKKSDFDSSGIDTTPCLRFTSYIYSSPYLFAHNFSLDSWMLWFGLFSRLALFFLLKFVRMNMKRLIWVTFGVYVFGGDSGCIVSCSFPKSDMKRNITFEVYIWYETPKYDLKSYDIKATPYNSNLDNVCSASKWGRHEDYRWRLKCFDGKYFQESPVCRVETIIVGKFNFFISIIWQFGMVCIKVCKSKIMIIRCIRFKSPCFCQITIPGGSLNNYLT